MIESATAWQIGEIVIPDVRRRPAHGTSGRANVDYRVVIVVAVVVGAISAVVDDVAVAAEAAKAVDGFVIVIAVAEFVHAATTVADVRLVILA